MARLKIVLLADLIELQTMSTVTNSLAAVTDIVISIVMILLLHVSKTGFKRSTDMINRLIIFTFNTGLPTSVCAIVAVVAINALSSTFVYIFFFILMGRFYTNSLLVTLNSRAYIRGMDTGGGSDSFSLTVPSSSRRPHGATTHQDPIAIRIETTRQRDHGYTPHIQDQDLKDNFEMSVAK
ncbi:hypothetical protein FISHEDRAFT_73423 [Fistulina hepatica ATCC 64428]|uniref:DUF6534 domain-containing protein n=1 Tax=Fistulina hepatica ATCC 64428 TaxID=1128425 RepID=A0A0D7AD98_9AGAR|nr:hypothetical protein FISHEDRAFT_73423 [Fistulina hepatica ATCC 64428]